MSNKNFKPNKKEAISQLNLLISISKDLIIEIQREQQDDNEIGACLASLDIITDNVQRFLVGETIKEIKDEEDTEELILKHLGFED